MNRVVSCVTASSLGDRELNGWDLHVKETGVENLILPLLLMKAQLQGLLSMLALIEEHSNLKRGNVDLISSEYNALLASSHEAAAHVAKGQLLVPFERTSVMQSCQQSDHNSSTSNALRREFKGRSLNAEDDEWDLIARSKRPYHTRNFSQVSSEGVTVLELDCPPPEEMDRDTYFRFSFFPSEGICKTGIMAQYSRSVRGGRQVRNYNKVWEHGDTEIWMVAYGSWWVEEVMKIYGGRRILKDLRQAPLFYIGYSRRSLQDAPFGINK